MAKTHLVKIILLLIMAINMVVVQAEFNRNFCVDKVKTFYSDPDDCTRFYTCILKITYYYTCPAGLFFNVDINVCDWPQNVNCVSRRNTLGLSSSTTFSTPEQPSSTPTSTESLLLSTGLFSSTLVDTQATALGRTTRSPHLPSWAICHDKTDGLYPDPESCNSFYQCSRGYSYNFKCQTDLFFNPDLNTVTGSGMSNVPLQERLVIKRKLPVVKPILLMCII
uniref:Chitin-binding type-2 domain-containing protein n=1 Tax=Arion vulgaris TaxID=1028688 RepID=A0A0B7B1V9_9EUPU